MTKKKSIKFAVIIFTLFLAGVMSYFTFTKRYYFDSNFASQNKQRETDAGEDKISYSWASNGKHDDLKGKYIQWTGMISDRDPANGIRFWIVDRDHQLSSWNYYEWFWAAPDKANMRPKLSKYEDSWVVYMMEKYGGIKKLDIDLSGIYQITGIFDGSDCDLYNQKDNNNNQVCAPKVIVNKIEKVGFIPSFEKYPIIERVENYSAELNLTSHPQAKKFKTVLSSAYSKGPNFAGHYTIATWGCGSTCQLVAVINHKDGKVFFPPYSTQVGSDFKLDSNLFITNPSEVLDEYRVTAEEHHAPLMSWEQFSSEYYKWENNHFVLIYPMAKK
jgi:hypothetical protein